MAPDGTSMEDPVSRSPLPYSKAFVVQFAAETDPRLATVSGRIEHLQTGRRSRFASADELLAGIMTMLADASGSPDPAGRAGTGTPPPSP
jgi:hypothetical protein